MSDGGRLMSDTAWGRKRNVGVMDDGSALHRARWSETEDARCTCHGDHTKLYMYSVGVIGTGGC